MLRSANVATPATAATDAVPESVPVPGLFPIVSVTAPAKPVAVFPCASCAVTRTAGVIAAPAAVAPGCTVKTSLAADPEVAVKRLVGALAGPPPPAPPAAATTGRGGAVARRAAAGGGSRGTGGGPAVRGVTLRGVRVVVRVPPPACSAYAPTLSTLRLENLATPATAATVVVPDRVPPGL